MGIYAQLIIVFGVLIAVAGLSILLNPQTILGYLRDNVDKPALQLTAVVTRLLLGVLLVSQSGLSRYPLVIEVLGWVAVVAAIALAVIGRKNFKNLMSWALSLINPYGRIGGVLAALFGAFLIYAFV